MSPYTSYRDPGSRRFGIAVSAVLHAAVIAALVLAWPGHRERPAHVPTVMSVFIPQRPETPVEPTRARPAAATAKPRPTPTTPHQVLIAPSLAPMELPTVASAIARSEQLVSAPVAAPPADSVPPLPPVTTPARLDAAYLTNPSPSYPPIARRNGEQGRVVLRVHVTPEGQAETIEVRISSGFERLDRAAVETVRHWRFVPARQGEHAVSAWVLVPITFSLDS